MDQEKPIRIWRISVPDQGPGLFVWFDPENERLSLRDLSEDEKVVTLDKLSSVSGLIRSDQAEESDGCNGALRKESPSFVQYSFLEEVDHG